MRPARAIINTQAIRSNLARVRELAPGRRVMVVVKANAYGHGIRTVAQAASAADAFGVACLEEALEIRESGARQPIVLLAGFFDPAELTAIGRNGIETVVHSYRQVEMLERASLSAPVGVWLKIDTGMHRLGFAPGEVEPVYDRLRACAHARKPIHVLTHLASAEDRTSSMTRQQCRVFDETTRRIAGARSVRNSAGILAWPEIQDDWVRPGLMVYGASPFPKEPGLEHQLQPVMTLESEVIAVRAVKAGEGIGYGAAWVARHDSTVAVIAIGYGDGYPRQAPSGTPVLVGGGTGSLVGRVAMDMIAVAVEEGARVQIGDRAVLWGRGLPVEEVASHVGTVAHQLLCSISRRVPLSVEGT